jgi:hypothetical protein
MQVVEMQEKVEVQVEVEISSSVRPWSGGARVKVKVKVEKQVAQSFVGLSFVLPICGIGVIGG